MSVWPWTEKGQWSGSTWWWHGDDITIEQMGVLSALRPDYAWNLRRRLNGGYVFMVTRLPRSDRARKRMQSGGRKPQRAGTKEAR